MSINICGTFLTSFSVVSAILFSRDLVVSALIKHCHDTGKTHVKHALSLACSTAIVPDIFAPNHNHSTYTALRGHSKSNNPAH